MRGVAIAFSPAGQALALDERVAERPCLCSDCIRQDKTGERRRLLIQERAELRDKFNSMRRWLDDDEAAA